MNGRQAAKMAAARIEELEYFNRSAAATIRTLYQAVDALLTGGDVCIMCEDYDECQLEAKNEGKGCRDWSHKYCNPDELPPLDLEGIQGLMGGADES